MRPSKLRLVRSVAGKSIATLTLDGFGCGLGPSEFLPARVAILLIWSLGLV
jgi:hypothetical protein